MPFYVGDWMKSPEIRSCTLAQRGLWFDLLCLMWESTERGVLVNPIGRPYTEDEIARMVGEGNLVNQILNQLEEKGVFSRRDKDNAIYCRRMIKEENIRKIRRRVGMLGGNPNLVIQKGNQMHEDENETENETETKKSFESFWSFYPKKQGKKKAFESWQKLSPNHELTQSILKAVSLQSQSEQWKKDGGQFVPMPATWLNQERWNDEPITERPKNADERIRLAIARA